MQQPGTQGSIAEHLASKLYLDTDYVKTAFKDGRQGLALLERQQVIVDSFKADAQHGVEFKCGYESGHVDVNQAKNYAALIDNGQMRRMDYLVMPNSTSSSEVAARNILGTLGVDPEVAALLARGEINVNYVNEHGVVMRVDVDSQQTPITLRR